MDRVQFYDVLGDLIGDTNILDLDQNVFSRSDEIIEESIDGPKSKIEQASNTSELFEKSNIKRIILKDYEDKPITFSETNKRDFFVRTLSEINLDNKKIGYILVSEQANDILNAVQERKDFIIRTVFAVALVILIFFYVSK